MLRNQGSACAPNAAEGNATRQPNGGRWWQKVPWRSATLALLAAVAVCASTRDTEAAGLLTPTGASQSLAIGSQQVSVRIDNGVAVTTVNQVFLNSSDQPLEALYTFPVPREASVSNFSMWIGGKEVIGEVLERERAREIYRQVTRVERKDPGLLEQVDFKTFEMRVFPVPARGEQRIQITYYQPVDYDNGFGTYVYPLEMDEAARTQLEGEFSLLVDVSSEIPLKRTYSPSHGEALVTAEVAPQRYRASIEAAQGNLDRDFVLVYELERERIGLEVLSARTGNEDGHFMLLLTPGAQFDEQKQQINVTFVVDASGSMDNVGKLDLARQAATMALSALRDTDTFNIIAFNVAPTSLADEPLPATAENRQAAVEFLTGLSGRGGTDIALALDRALTMQVPEARNAIVLLSDGQASATDDHGPFLAAVRERGGATRIFSFGIGNEVNRPLLDRLAAASGGLADYVSGQDDIERKVRLMQAKLSSAVAENLSLEISGVETYDLVPQTLPNLYRGQQLVVFGRYRGAGDADVTLTCKLLGSEEKVTSRVSLADDDKLHPHIARMWAWRKVDTKLASLSSDGSSASAIDEIVKLGTEYSIVTPFTSFLVLENEAEYQRFSIERRNVARVERERRAIESEFALRSPSRTQSAPAPDTVAAAPRNEQFTPSDTSRSRGGGGGGSVEWLFLASGGALLAGKLCRRKNGMSE